MKEQALAAFGSCYVVGVTQEDASRIGRCKGTPIRSGVSSELATELLPASPGRLQNRLSGGEWIMHLEQVRWYHLCTCTRYNGHLPKCDFSFKYNGNLTGVPPGTRVVPSYLLRVQEWYRSTSRSTAVPPEGTSVVPSCLLSLRCMIHSLRNLPPALKTVTTPNHSWPSIHS